MRRYRAVAQRRRGRARPCKATQGGSKTEAPAARSTRFPNSSRRRQLPALPAPCAGRTGHSWRRPLPRRHDVPSANSRATRRTSPESPSAARIGRSTASGPRSSMPSICGRTFFSRCIPPPCCGSRRRRTSGGTGEPVAAIIGWRASTSSKPPIEAASFSHRSASSMAARRSSVRASIAGSAVASAMAPDRSWNLELGRSLRAERSRGSSMPMPRSALSLDPDPSLRLRDRPQGRVAGPSGPEGTSAASEANVRATVGSRRSRFRLRSRFLD